MLDAGWQEAVKPRLAGRAPLNRYADDSVIGFADASDARRVTEVLPKRFGEYGPALHPDKPRLVPLARPRGPKGRGEPGSGNRPGTFDSLGFPPDGGKSRRDNAVVKQRTAARRIRRFAHARGEWCRRNRHRPVPERHATLSQELRGHDACDGVRGNGSSLSRRRAIAARAEVAVPAELERPLRRGAPVGSAGAAAAAGSTGRPRGVPARVQRWPDEPEAAIPHVRIGGSPGWVTAQGDPAK